MKVLIVSHNPISTYQNMGKTFLSLFSSFDREELCQLYIYPTEPDVALCRSSFRITDQDVLKSYFHFGLVHSREISAHEIDTSRHEWFDSPETEHLYRQKKNVQKMLLRDLMWKCSGYYNSALKHWLEKERPDCMFVAPGQPKLIYDMALRISKARQIPIVTYICDEYYFVETPAGHTEKLQLCLLRKKMEQLMANSAALVTICDPLNRLYRERFGVPSYTVMTGSNLPVSDRIRVRDQVTTLTYMGNLSFGRWRSLAEIGRTLDEINRREGTDCRLNLYTAARDDEKKRFFQGISSVQFCGFVTGEKFAEVLGKSDVLVHAEGFDPEAVNRVKNSISTKIAESLGSGIPLLAYGPENIASISYLRENDCACVISNPDALNETLSKLIASRHLRESYAQKGLTTAVRNHSSGANSRRLHELLTKVSKAAQHN